MKWTQEPSLVDCKAHTDVGATSCPWPQSWSARIGGREAVQPTPHLTATAPTFHLPTHPPSDVKTNTLTLEPTSPESLLTWSPHIPKGDLPTSVGQQTLQASLSYDTEF